MIKNRKSFKVIFILFFLAFVFGHNSKASTFGAVNSSQVLNRQLVITGSQFRKGASAPTDATIGSTPTTGVLLFDATGELVSVSIPIPFDMDLAVNPTLVLFISLSATETNADTLDLTMDYSAVNATQLYTKTSTQITSQTTVTTGNGLAIATSYTNTFTFNVADATNPIGATTNTLQVEFHLTNTTGVGEFHLVSGRLAYQSTH